MQPSLRTKVVISNMIDRIRLSLNNSSSIFVTFPTFLSESRLEGHCWESWYHTLAGPLYRRRYRYRSCYKGDSLDEEVDVFVQGDDVSCEKWVSRRTEGGTRLKVIHKDGLRVESGVSTDQRRRTSAKSTQKVCNDSGRNTLRDTVCRPDW